MRFVFLPALTLWAALPVATAWEIKPGTVSLALSPDSDSSLGLDFTRFVDTVCPGASQEKGTGRINCGVSIDPTRSDPVEGSIEVGNHPGKLLQAFLEVTELHLVGREPWKTPCGDFDFAVTLDSKVEQPVSELTLAPDGDAAHGVFSGLLDVALSLRFKAVAGGRTVEVPTRLQIPVGGPYLLADAPEPGPGEPPTSNVVLLARRRDCYVTKAEFCAAWAHCCPALCLTAPALTDRRMAPPEP